MRSERPLRGVYEPTAGYIYAIVRWPLDRLIPALASLFGSSDLVIRWVTPLLLVIAIGAFASTCTVKPCKGHTRLAVDLASAAYSVLSIICICTRLPSKTDELSTIRSYLLIAFMLAQCFGFIGNFVEDMSATTIKGIAGITHTNFIVQTYLLTGLYQLVEESTGSEHFIVLSLGWMLLFGWSIFGFVVLPDDQDEAKPSDDGSWIKKPSTTKASIPAVSSAIRLIAIDMILLSLIQFG